jgi:hypothetical protein
MCEQLERFRTVQNDNSFVYQMPRPDGEESWYLIRHGQVVAVIDEPRDGPAAKRCLNAVEQTYGCGPLAGMREDVEMTMLVAGRFRNYPDELRRAISPDASSDRLRTIGADAGANR